MRKLIYSIIVLFIALTPVVFVNAVKVSTSSVSMYVGETKSVTVYSEVGAGEVVISSNSNNIAITSGSGSQWLEGQLTISFRGVSTGSATITIYLNDYAESKTKDLSGQSFTVRVNVSNRPVQTQAPQTQAPQTQPTTAKPTTTKANVETPTEPTTEAPVTTTVAPGAPKLKNLKVVGYDIDFKANTLEYTIKVSEDVTELYVIADKEDENSNITGNGIVKVKDVDQIAVSLVEPNTGQRTIYLVNIIHVKSAAKVKKSSSTLNIILLLIALFIAIAIIVVLVLRDQGIIGVKEVAPVTQTPEPVAEKVEENTEKDAE